MKNIIYGLGSHFMNNAPLITEVLKDTIAFCDSKEDVRKKFPDGVIGKPVIAPNEIKDYMSGDVKIIVTSKFNFEEITNFLVSKYNLSKEQIECLELPNQKLLNEIYDFIDKNAYGPNVPIKLEAFADAKLLPNRQFALEYMPKNAVCAEIGVAYGEFSSEILNEMKPSKFYAIDLFSEENPYYWGRDTLVKENITHRQWYERKFATEIEAGILETRKGLSWDEIEKFPDDYFDYVYLDASHIYDSIMKDLSILPSKVKDGGFIQFNDYTGGIITTMGRFGVISAVNQFVNSGEHKVKYFCLSSSQNSLHDLVVQVKKG